MAATSKCSFFLVMYGGKMRIDVVEVIYGRQGSAPSFVANMAMYAMSLGSIGCKYLRR